MVTTTKRGRTVGSGNKDMLFVSFALAGTEYGIEVAEVFGIYQGLPIIPMPDAPAHVAGEVQLVNRRIPVVNLRKFAGMNDVASLRSPHWIIIVDHPRGPIGYIVDRVSEVMKLTPANLVITDPIAPGPVGDYVMAVAKHGDDTVYLPDFSRLAHDTTVQ